MKTSAHDPDVGRRVIQCACGASLAWRGPEQPRETGWRSRWKLGPDRKLRRFWACPDHVEDLLPAPSPASSAASASSPGFVVPSLAHLLTVDTCLEQPARAHALLGLALDTSPDAVVVLVQRVIPSARRAGRRDLADLWTRWASDLGIPVDPPPPRRPRRSRRRSDSGSPPA